MLEHEDGFTIIRPQGTDPTIPLECPVCQLLMRVAGDAESYRKHGACSDCSIGWAEGGSRAERWQQGWRPDPAVVAEQARIRSLAPFTPKL